MLVDLRKPQESNSFMKQFHVSRNGAKFGPYEETEAKKFYKIGNIAATDLVWCEGMAEWKSAAEVFGMPEVRNSMPPVPPLPPFQPPPAPGYAPNPLMQGNIPLPPKLHWALVLLFGIFSFGIFYLVWLFIQASWVRKIDSRSNAVMYLIAYILLAFTGGAMGAIDYAVIQVFGGLAQLAGVVFFCLAYYSMRESMTEYYNNIEPINLKISGVMTFFFTTFYLQHHMTRIAEWKMTGFLRPQ